MKLRTENIQKSYKGRKVVKGVTVEVNQGEIVGLLGPNGAGKTTSFYMIVGLVKPDEGKVFLDSNEITTTAMYKRAQMGIGYLPQEVSVFRKLSVEDNIMAVLEMTKLNKSERKQKLEDLLNEFTLNHVRKNKGSNLSGGEKRRTEIARALATDPKFILLDEPFAGVDPIAVEDIQSIVYKLKQRDIGVLITDHNVQETLSITDRAYLLFQGSILKEGTAEELASDRQVRKLYLGEHFELRKKRAELSDDSSGNEDGDDREQLLKSLQFISATCEQLISKRYISEDDMLRLSTDWNRMKADISDMNITRKDTEEVMEAEFDFSERKAQFDILKLILGIATLGTHYGVVYFIKLKRWRQRITEFKSRIDTAINGLMSRF